MYEEFFMGKLLLKESESFDTFDPSDIDPVTPKSIGFLCCSGRMCEEGIFELLIGNEKVTDGQTDQLTDRPTSAKQYALSSSKGGIKTKRTIFSVDLNDKMLIPVQRRVWQTKQK